MNEKLRKPGCYKRMGSDSYSLKQKAQKGRLDNYSEGTDWEGGTARKVKGK